MINGDPPTLGPNAGRKARKIGSARARRCFRCARACPLHRKGANSTVNDRHLGKCRLKADGQPTPIRTDRPHPARRSGRGLDYDNLAAHPQPTPKETLMQVQLLKLPALPKLAWLCIVDKQSGAAIVQHGSAVETSDGFAIEGVWDDDFNGGRFNTSTVFFGSGLRWTDGAITFTPSCALVDRLLYAESGARLAVANSLPLLLAATGGQLDPHHDYRHESWTSLDGIWRYDPAFSVLGPADLSYRQLIYRSMTLRDGSISFSYRDPGPPFRTFEDYSEHFRLVLARLAQNARDRARRRPMEITTTLSSGYELDSSSDDGTGTRRGRVLQSP